MGFEKPLPPDQEELINKLHDSSQREVVPQAEFEQLVSSVEHSELYNTYERYQTGACPNLNSIATDCERLITILIEERDTTTNDKERGELEKTISYLKGRRNYVAYSINEYTDSIAQWWRIRNSQHHMDTFKYRDLLESIEKKRRRQHDALMDSLRGYTETVYKLVHDGYLDNDDVRQWDGWYVDLRQSIDSAKKAVTVFSPQVLSHERRAEIQLWAIAADLHESLECISSHRAPTDSGVIEKNK